MYFAPNTAMKLGVFILRKNKVFSVDKALLELMIGALVAVIKLIFKVVYRCL